MRISGKRKLQQWGLKTIKLHDKEMFHYFTKHCDYPANLWSSNFDFLWADSLSNSKHVYWKIINDMLVPFVYWNKLGLHLACLPLGQGSPYKVLYTSYIGLSFCNKWNKENGYSFATIRNVNANQLDYIKQSPYFNRYFESMIIKGLERHFSIEKVSNYAGKEFKDVRYSVNCFNREFPHAIIRRYRPTDYEALLKVNTNWIKTSGKKHSQIFDQVYFKEITKHFAELEHIILVVEIDDQIVGVVSAGITPQGQSWGCFIKRMRNVRGLNEVMIVEITKEIKRLNPNVELLNVGSDLGEKGLVTFKEKFRPVHSLEKHRIRLK